MQCLAFLLGKVQDLQLHKWTKKQQDCLCACKCDKDGEISEYLKDWEFTKTVVDDLVVTCDKIDYTPKSAGSNKLLAYCCCSISSHMLTIADVYCC